MNPLELHWLPRHHDFKLALQAARSECDTARKLQAVSRLARFQSDFLQTIQIDRAFSELKRDAGDVVPELRKFRLAILPSATVEHLLPGIRVAGLRFGLDIEIFQGALGQFRQEVESESSPLWDFRPDGILFLTGHRDALACGPAETWRELDSLAEQSVAALRPAWKAGEARSGARILVSTVPPLSAPEFGSYDALAHFSQLSMLAAFNNQLARTAADDGLLLLDIAAWAARVGSRNWFDPALWHHAKQDVRPQAAALFGDIVARKLAAVLGRSRKCLVLDLDNTLWGGVIGDDGLDGIVLGQGSASGEAFLAFQQYAKKLSERGIILAVCSKNDETVARHALANHSEMQLRDGDFACIVANWQDKAGNLRAIARTLNIGVDSLVFADDNPAERDLVRRELPEVAVPEMPEDPAYFPYVIADAGYFESAGLTAEDLTRSRQYQENLGRGRLKSEASDMASYLKGLDMTLTVGAVDSAQLTRTVQLINKTNQFNLTTRRYSEADIVRLMQRDTTVAIWGRLTDRFGDNGLITVIIAIPGEGGSWRLDTWLMSCRVLGRQVEQAMLGTVAERCGQLGAVALCGEYIRTPKNGMVADHYAKLGFENIETTVDRSVWRLPLASYVNPSLPMTVRWHHG
jgi:FkbH-like protein